jgi:hypothetical protein
MASAKMPPAASVFGTGGAEPPAPEADIPEDFELHAIEAFPDLEGDPVRLAALKSAIHACMKSYSSEE